MSVRAPQGSPGEYLCLKSSPGWQPHSGALERAEQLGEGCRLGVLEARSRGLVISRYRREKAAGEASGVGGNREWGAATGPTERLFPDWASNPAWAPTTHSVPVQCWPLAFVFKLWNYIYARSRESKYYKSTSGEKEASVCSSSCPGPASGDCHSNHLFLFWSARPP